MSELRRQDPAGFTLVELMVALTILALVMAGVFQSFSGQLKSSMVTEEVVEAQQNLRAIASLIEREIRMAGFMVPDGAGVCGVDATTGPDQLFISETEPLIPDDETVGDMGARVTSNLSAAGNQTWVLDLTTVDLDGDGAFFYDNDGNGTPESDFRTGAGFILTDLQNPGRGAVCGIVTNASPTNFQISLVSAPFATLTVVGQELVVVPAAHYRINGAGRLERNQDLLARGVDDIQVAYFFDVDDDGDVDSVNSEYPGANGGLVYLPASWQNANLKEVRFNIVVRARRADSEFTGGAFQTLENRVDPALGADGFRRRVVVATVRPRNIGADGGI